MARREFMDVDSAVLGQAPAGAEAFYRLGMMYSIGSAVPTDLVSAHKWFNLAAMKGNPDAIRLRQEVAASMSPAEIAEAQRAARAFLTAH
jgi:TPR repeat protein